MFQLHSHFVSLVAVAMLFLVPRLHAAQAAANYPVDQPLPVQISAADKNIRLIGRFDASDPNFRKYQWPASAITIHFDGTALNVKLADSGNNRHEVIVDGKVRAVLTPGPGSHLYRVAADLPAGEHTVTLVKRTESFFGIVSFEGAQLNEGGKLLAAKPAERRIEVIGDSISCGYGDEAASQNEHFSPATENACMTYGALTARAFDAEFVDIAWSGRKLWPNFTIPEIYDLTLPEKKESKWDFAGYQPQVILINLATNDFGGGKNPDEAGWVKAYHDFLDHLREKNPNATIYLALGSMMSDGWPKGQNALSTARKYMKRVVAERTEKGDKQIHFIEFAPQDAKNGLGSDWHPNLKTHKLMADVFIEAIARDVGWKPVEPAKQ